MVRHVQTPLYYSRRSGCDERLGPGRVSAWQVSSSPGCTKARQVVPGLCFTTIQPFSSFIYMYNIYRLLFCDVIIIQIRATSNAGYSQAMPVLTCQLIILYGRVMKINFINRKIITLKPGCRCFSLEICKLEILRLKFNDSEVQLSLD